MKDQIDTGRIIQKLLLSQPISIPVFHEVALRLMQMMNDHSYRIEEAIKLVNEDTALASQMLRHANTTYNSGKTPITTIKNAIVRLGSQQIVNLAFTASMANNKSDNPVIHSYLKKLWHHCHAVAITSAWLAVETSHGARNSDTNPDEVYLAGLLHGIGKLYLLKSMDNLIKADIMQPDHSFIDEILEGHNIAQGVRVMQHWNIPNIYVNSLERHVSNNWKTGTNDYLVAAVRLSCKMHHYVENDIELEESSEASELVNDELLFLDIDDAAYVYDMVKAIVD